MKLLKCFNMFDNMYKSLIGMDTYHVNIEKIPSITQQALDIMLHKKSPKISVTIDRNTQEELESQSLQQLSQHLRCTENILNVVMTGYQKAIDDAKQLQDRQHQLEEDIMKQKSDIEILSQKINTILDITEDHSKNTEELDAHPETKNS